MTFNADEGVEYVKTQTVMARQATDAGTIETPEGVMSYSKDDYIVGPGAGGEYWPVKRAIFEASYAKVEAQPLAAKLTSKQLPTADRMDLAYEKRRRREVKLVPHPHLISMAMRFDGRGRAAFNKMTRAEVEEAVVQGELKLRAAKRPKSA